ncbi:MAG: tetratricopeptide repeat protein, partial [Lachnospiraceae bacterium]|nr:tetratricopeptide repeat protein [Lachnospiraceae bacterium]
NQFRQKLDELKKAGPLELQKRKGDFFLDVRQYGNALSTYDQLLAQRQTARDKDFQARIWHNRGIACVQLMQYREAMECFAKAWEVLRLESIAKEMFVLYCMDDQLSMPETVIASVPGETQYRWKEELDAFEKNAAYVGKAEDIAIAFNKDVIRRREAIRSLLASWKQEYREMAG